MMLAPTGDYIQPMIIGLVVVAILAIVLLIVAAKRRKGGPDDYDDGAGSVVDYSESRVDRQINQSDSNSGAKRGKHAK